MLTYWIVSLVVGSCLLAVGDWRLVVGVGSWSLVVVGLITG